MGWVVQPPTRKKIMPPIFRVAAAERGCFGSFCSSKFSRFDLEDPAASRRVPSCGGKNLQQFPGIPTTIKTMGVNITTIAYLRVLTIEIGEKPLIILMVVEAQGIGGFEKKSWVKRGLGCHGWRGWGFNLYLQQGTAVTGVSTYI